MNCAQKGELAAILLSLIGKAIELILFFEAIEEENKEERRSNTGQDELNRQIEALSYLIGKIEKNSSIFPRNGM
jgi:hypothetical protein